ncbi:integrase, partial [Paraburkholderia sp. CNPSo 3155]|uniref:phage integrase family protein n=1 Tax=Paraburkholderia atlantica TaxID=2654982 RepID=UPI001328D473
MKTRRASIASPQAGDPPRFPAADELAVLRAWYAGLPVREAVERYQSALLGGGKSARAAHRDDLAALLDHPAEDRARHAKAVAHAIEALRTARPPEPQITDDVAQWLAPRAVRVLHADGIRTLADLTVRIPRRRQWWKAVPGLGVASARAIETF